MRVPLLASLILCAVSAAPAVAGTADPTAAPAAPSVAAEPAANSWFQPAYLALFKTISYTTVVLTTDQLWYMGVAAQAATTSGVFGAVNLVTSPMLTYAFEFAWERCCEAPPGPDGVRPVSVKKALIYRVLSTSRILGLALVFGNGVRSSLLVTGAIAATRTLAYLGNDYVWNRVTALAPRPTTASATSVSSR
jgi:hypothetical protein